MNTHTRWFRAALAVSAALLVVVAAAPRPTFAAPTASQAMERLMRGYEGLRDYQSNLVVRVLMPNMDVPDMPVTAYWKAPDRTALRARGFAVVPEQGVFLLPTVFGPDRFTPIGLRVERENGALRYHVELKPRPGTFSKFARSAGAVGGESQVDPVADAPVHLWIDPTTWTITRARTTVPSFAGGGPMELDARVRYGTWQGYKLPSRTDVKMTLPGGMPAYSVPRPGTGRHGDAQAAPPAGPTSGRVILTFSNYRVNRGVPESVFSTASSR